VGIQHQCLKGKIVPIEKQKIVTEEHTIECKMQLMKVATTCKKFSVMGGIHLTSDDILLPQRWHYGRRRSSIWSVEEEV
jgi:hypothetical protein